VVEALANKKLMTVIEQLINWAEAPGSEIFVGFSYSDKPYVVQRVKARDAARGLQKLADANRARVKIIKGITCVVIKGPELRVVLSQVEPFT